ncbi:MAG TPA: FtsX-like permease family protein [Desulfatiglandales bacterium]|nr:FtsX-like permease family protein [Desulfatiglandales bacterium]
MRTVEFVTKEMGRRKRKTTAGILCILLGISIFVAAQTINSALYDKAKEQLLRFGANIIIQPGGELFDTNALTQGTALLPEVYGKRIQTIEHGGMIVAVSPKLHERFVVGDVSLSVAGITEDEIKAKPWWMIDRKIVTDQFPQGNEILLGHYTAAHVGPVSQVKLGDEVFRVSGILDETGSADDLMAFVPLHILQGLTGRERLVNVIEVSTSCISCSTMNLYDIADEIDKALPDDARVIPVKQIAEAQIGTLTKIEDFIRIVYIVVLCLGGFLVMNYMSSTVSDRRHEIGILLAIGADARKLYTFFILKALFLGVIGGLAGYALGTIISMAAGPQLAGTPVPPILHLLPYSVAISTAICITASILPAKRAAQLDPVEALQEV